MLRPPQKYVPVMCCNFFHKQADDNWRVCSAWNGRKLNMKTLLSQYCSKVTPHHCVFLCIKFKLLITPLKNGWEEQYCITVSDLPFWVIRFAFVNNWVCVSVLLGLNYCIIRFASFVFVSFISLLDLRHFIIRFAVLRYCICIIA